MPQERKIIMEKTYYELTNPQKSIWLISQMDPNSPVGNVCGRVLIQEEVDFLALEKSINHFVEKNDSFRIMFFNTNSRC